MERKTSGQLADGERYIGIRTPELIGQFYETKGDPAIGRELSIRLLEHAGLGRGVSDRPLAGRDGRQVVAGDRPLVLADYVNYAAEHHFAALDEVFNFFLMQEGTPDYEAARAGMLARINAGKINASSR